MSEPTCIEWLDGRIASCYAGSNPAVGCAKAVAFLNPLGKPRGSGYRKEVGGRFRRLIGDVGGTDASPCKTAPSSILWRT